LPLQAAPAQEAGFTIMQYVLKYSSDAAERRAQNRTATEAPA